MPDQALLRCQRFRQSVRDEAHVVRRYKSELPKSGMGSCPNLPYQTEARNCEGTAFGAVTDNADLASGVVPTWSDHLRSAFGTLGASILAEIAVCALVLVGDIGCPCAMLIDQSGVSVSFSAVPCNDGMAVETCHHG